ncbi:bifunctional DnaJ domain/Chaperone J-domain superfamily [Babesia duncani]|uniref:Bifunctional DnaJ domain/Chaperone J-domain superfamily n=1 Tax=Babesia duncani TaxID=323732 RepID=A0AAD9UP78_9APIC|nr:bifunctional DnaJ domain/Chaperone J-domain superfamily [Babesia duncani]
MDQLLLSIFVFTPLIDFLCNPKRKWNKYNKDTGRYVAISLVIFVVFYKSLKKEKNYFELLNVTPHASSHTIKKAFKSSAFLMHPDRNDATSPLEFTKFVEYYHIISKPNLRQIYSRFGDILSLEEEAASLFVNANEILYIIGIRTFTSFVVTVFMFLSSTNSKSLSACLTYDVFSTFLDIYLRFAPESEHFLYWAPILKYYTIFELVAFFRDYKMIFLYHSSLIERKNDISPDVASSLIKNNKLLIGHLNDYLRQCSRVTGTPIEKQKEILKHSKKEVDVLVDFEPLWDAAIKEAGITYKDASRLQIKKSMPQFNQSRLKNT